MLYVPSVATLPEITPVAPLMLRPDGNPVALQPVELCNEAEPRVTVLAIEMGAEL